MRLGKLCNIDRTASALRDVTFGDYGKTEQFSKSGLTSSQLWSACDGMYSLPVMQDLTRVREGFS